MGLSRLGRLIGIILLLANLAWGVECGNDDVDLKDQLESFVERIIAQRKTDIDSSSQTKTAYVFTENKAHVGSTLYCGLIARFFGASMEGSKSVVSLRAMCFNLYKKSKEDSGGFKGFCLALNPKSIQSQIIMEFEQNTFNLHINESYLECGHKRFNHEILIFKPIQDRLRSGYVLQEYSRESDAGLDPFYRQQRDGKTILMDEMDFDVLQDLQQHCYEKKYCKEGGD
ncbi:hypothetical protein ACFOPX_06390 [Helicobacter baculiformis]|uniref:Periplasmic protein n=1 Tax=Helicobacter baculiformis TaxID=427351 RepID=A0ABV7ZIX0_9HELI|nr:hypothetical protein [Helicobacter baculiformis]